MGIVKSFLANLCAGTLDDADSIRVALGRELHPADRQGLASHMVAVLGLRHTGMMQGGSDVKSVRYLSMLDYRDGPLLFEARDAIGGQYLAMAVETSDGGDGYAVVGVAPNRLCEFRAGRLDLRALVEEAGKEDWYLTQSADFSEPLMLERQRVPMADSGLLPDHGYVLD